MSDTTNTKADKLGEAGALRAEALHEARKVLAPVAVFGSGQTLDADGSARLVELAEYIATGEHWTLTDDDEDDEPIAGAFDGSPGGLTFVYDEASRFAGAPVDTRTIVEKVIDLADDSGCSLMPWQKDYLSRVFSGDVLRGIVETREAVRDAAGPDDEQGEKGSPEDEPDHTGTGESPRGDGTGPHLHVAERAEAKVHPLTHREPSRWSILIDRQGDGWEYSETRGGWAMAGSLTACSWGPGFVWGPFTITGAAPGVADTLATWKPGEDPEPRHTATLVDEFGREWEFTPEETGNEGWRIVRGAQGQPIVHPTPRAWAAPMMYGREFTIRTEGTKR